ncbi:MAG: hypothetical protein KIT11_08790 [Fimbriimonadaceae bacterium]|nr:hypothetical protein [Fimbriimonadaceae bacterium]QYK55423.1 MAG: hypothetical protein KF733_10460 [Fimbriimonadaceae bacterium]
MVVATLCLLLVGQTATVQGVPVSRLLADAAAYDGKAVSVSGQVGDLEQKTSKKGNKYTVFKLASGKESVSVYMQGWPEPALKQGDSVNATGVFERERKVGSFTVKNQLDATKVKGTDYGVKLLKRGSGA